MKEFEKDINEYFAKEQDKNERYKVELLKEIFEKHIEAYKVVHTVTVDDFLVVLTEARKHYIKATFPVRMGNKELETQDGIYLSVLEAFTYYLGRNKLVRKIIKFDYKVE